MKIVLKDSTNQNEMPDHMMSKSSLWLVEFKKSICWRCVKIVDRRPWGLHDTLDPCRLCFISNTSQLVRRAFPWVPLWKREVLFPLKSECCERGQEKGWPDLSTAFLNLIFPESYSILCLCMSKIRKWRRKSVVEKVLFLAFGDHHHHHRLVLA